MATLTPVQAKITGTTTVWAAAAAGGDKIAPGPHTLLRVKNGSAASIAVTVAVPGNTRFGQPEPDVVVAVAAGAEVEIGPFPVELADSTDRLVHITYSATTTVTVAAVQI